MRREEGGRIEVVSGILKLVIAKALFAVQAAHIGEEVIRVLVVGRKRGQEEILLCRIEVERRTVLEVVASARHGSSYCAG